MATATIDVRTDNEIKLQAQEIFTSLGLDMTTAVNLFLRQTVRAKDLPFVLTTKTTEKPEHEALAVGQGSVLPYGLGCMKGKIWLSDDFDEPLDDFAEYM